MQAHLFGHSRRDFQADISKLATELPPDIVSSASLFVIDAADEETTLPRYIAATSELTNNQIDALRSAVAGLGADDLELQIGFAEIPPVNAEVGAGDLPASFFGVSDAELTAADRACIPVTEALREIMEAKETGIDYPEKSWTGDTRRAYDVFVKRLGRAPMEDKGASLTPYMVGRAAENRPRDIDAATWDKVRTHLERELRLFEKVAEWFSTRGYVHGLINDQRSFDDDFVRRMNDTYLGLNPNKSISISLDVCMTLAARAIGTIKGYGTGLSAMISALWIVTKGVLPDPKAKIEATIDEMHGRVHEIFRGSLKALERTDEVLGNDWGLLDRFGTLLESGDLVWPRDLSPLRSAQSRAFQYVALQSTIPLLTGSRGASWVEIGVVQVTVKVKGKQNGKWSGTHYLTHSVYSKGGACGVGKGWYLHELYLGYRVVSPGSQAPLPQDAPEKLQKKLFGQNIHDESDPDFALTQAFLIWPSDPQRKDWALPQLCFSK